MEGGWKHVTSPGLWAARHSLVSSLGSEHLTAVTPQALQRGDEVTLMWLFHEPGHLGDGGEQSLAFVEA